MDAWTILALMGTAAIAVGVGMYSLPAGIIAGGFFLVAIGIAGAARKAAFRKAGQEVSP